MQQYNLAWHTYSEHQREMMREMMICDDFKDVTLISDDKKPIKAHRNILSVCSPLFKNIFQMDTNNHPVIYLRGIKHSEIESILQFIYLGETKLSNHNLNELLLVAKNLEIEEFSKNVEVVRLQYSQSDHSTNSGLHYEPTENIKSEDDDEIQDDEVDEKFQQKIKEDRKNNIKKFSCNQCDYQAKMKKYLTTHIESKHEGKYTCNQCDFKALHQSHLTRHRQSKHEGVKYNCNQCDFQSTRQDHLTAHIQSKHEGVRYACNHCDYEATQQSHLNYHIQCKHTGVKYACTQCDYQASHHFSLRTHIQSKHEGVKFVCNKCDQQFTVHSNLTRHIQSQH